MLQLLLGRYKARNPAMFMASEKIESNTFKQFVTTSGTSKTIKGVGNYGVAVCFCLVQGVGSAIFNIAVNAQTVTKTHISGNQNATNAINITSSGNNTLTFEYPAPGFTIGVLCGLASELVVL